MGWIGRILKGTDGDMQSRSLEDPSVPLSAATLQDLGEGNYAQDAGVAVTTRSALGYAPLYQAVSMISGDVAKLPLNVYRRTQKGRQRQQKHPVDRRISLKAMANEEINAFKFWRRFMVSALLWGNAYAWIDRNGNGDVLGVYNLLPDRTAPARYKGQLYFVTEVGGQMEAFRNENILHVEGLSLDGLCGANIVKAFREDFGIALARRRFTAKFFKQGMTAGGILQVPPSAKPEAVRKVQGKINEKFSSVDQAFKTVVLRDGFKWFSTQIDPEKAQLQAMDEQQARNVARMFNLNPSRLGVAGSTSYNSAEMAQYDYHNCCLSHWLIGNVAETNNKLLSEQEREDDFYIDYLINAMLWADSKTRSEIANQGIANGRFSPNETRAWENLDDYEGGDTYYRPLNLAVVGEDPEDTDPPKDPADDPEDDTENSRSTGSLRKLLKSTFTRATNRLAIKAERTKGPIADSIASERAAVLEILEPALAVAIEYGQRRETVEQLAATWWDTWLRSEPGDAGALRVSAETAAAQLIESILRKDNP